MCESAIRQLATCEERSLVAAARFESTIQIWPLEGGHERGQFESVLDFGGRRLTFAANGSVCIAGSWKHGVAAYSVPDGVQVWERRDLIHVQQITRSGSGQQIYCGLEEGPLWVVDSVTGSTREKMRGAVAIYASPYCSYELIAERNGYRIRGQNERDIPALSFTLAGAALSPTAVCLSEPKSGIRCIDLDSGNLLWHHNKLASIHLAYNTSDRNFYCVATAQVPPHDWSLIRLATSFLDCDRVAQFGQCPEAAFTGSGRVLVTAQGDVYETATGSLLTHLDFPHRTLN